MRHLGAAILAAGLAMATGDVAVAQDSAKADTAKADTAKADTAKADTAKADTAKADTAKGEALFNRCSACHALDHAVVGPPLGGVIGRKAGSVDGYSYSPLMRSASDAGLVWTEAELVDYMHNPTEYLTNYVKSKGKDASGSSKMIFAMSNETQRRNVAAYLATTKP